MKAWQLGILLCLLSGSALAVMHRETVAFADGDTELKGYLYWDDAFSGQRPGVMVVHEQWGLNDYARLRAEMLAEMGYVAFAADLYGAGKKTRHAEEANAWMQQTRADADLWKRRVQLSLQQLESHPKVRADTLAAIGYGFGADSVLQLAYSGADLKGVVAFHGSLPAATADQAAAIKTRILIAHGDADPLVPPDAIEAFKTALSDGGVDWEMVTYGRAMHSFSNPYADGYGLRGLAYQEEADRRAWLRMLAFFEDVFEAEF
jgi:dienelactone hydrolase